MLFFKRSVGAAARPELKDRTSPFHGDSLLTYENREQARNQLRTQALVCFIWCRAKETTKHDIQYT